MSEVNRRIPDAKRVVNEQKPETAPGVFASDGAKKWRLAAVGVVVAILAGGAFAVWKGVQRGQSVDRWERLAAIAEAHDDTLSDLAGAAGPAVDALAREDFIQKLEDFVAKEAPDAPSTVHAHSMIANLEMTQILDELSSGKQKDLTKRYDSAERHWKAVKDSGLELPLTANRFRPAEAARTVDLLLQKLAVDRTWDAAHGIRDAETDPDVVVLLRTTEGDLRVRLYSKPDQSPLLAKAFVTHACKGELDGTLFFAKSGNSDEPWLRGGDKRIKKTDVEATDEQRLKWGDASPGDPILPEAGRHRIAHVKGTLAAWHQDDDPYDDAVQFLLESDKAPKLDTDYTPFGRVDDASFPALERLGAARTRRDEKPEITLDSALSKLADQIAKPPVIVRALVYEKGVLSSCYDASKVDESERKLDTVKPDAVRVIPPPPPPVPTPAPATPATPPAAPDAAAMGAVPPAMTDTPPH